LAERSDAITLVMGPRGKVGAGRLLSAGKKVAVVEKNFCGAKAATGLVSRKTLIRPREARNEAKRTQVNGEELEAVHVVVTTTQRPKRSPLSGSKTFPCGPKPRTNHDT
jgi:pyruvate/2-oxoglutarate dehydrogenase complex dihydrolipoamide dehydrogenase (E3) component